MLMTLSNGMCLNLSLLKLSGALQLGGEESSSDQIVISFYGGLPLGKDNTFTAKHNTNNKALGRLFPRTGYTQIRRDY